MGASSRKPAVPQFTRADRARHDYDDPLAAQRDEVDLPESGASETLTVLSETRVGPSGRVMAA
jgi:hypothetical protein